MDNINSLKKEAKIFLRNSQWIKAQETLIKMNGILRNNAIIKHKLGDVCVKLNNHWGAQYYYMTAMRLDRNNAEICFKLAKVLGSLGQYQQAKMLFQNCLRSDGRTKGSAHYHYGKLLMKLDEPYTALHHFWRATQLKPDVVAYHVAHATVSVQLGFPNVARNSIKITLASHDLVDKEALMIIKDYVNHGINLKVK